MNRQAIIEYVLDMWVTNSDLKYIRENYRGFYDDPIRYKNLADMIRDDLGADVDTWNVCVNV